MFNKERLLEYGAQVRHHAELVLAKDGSMDPVIGIWKDDEVMLWIFPRNPREGEHGRDPVLAAAWMSIIGLGPDVITMANDVYQVAQQNKKDGTPWGPGEMQYAREHNTEDAELVSDALSISFYERTGDTGHLMIEYKLDGDQVIWGEENSFVEGEDDQSSLEGFMIDTIREAFRQPTLMDRIKAEWQLEEGLEDASFIAAHVMDGPPRMSSPEMKEWVQEYPKQAYAHQCCAVIKSVLLPAGNKILIGTSDPEVAEIFVHSMSMDPGISVYSGTDLEEIATQYQTDQTLADMAEHLEDKDVDEG